MGKLLDLDVLKSEYVGKTYNWLTVLDVKRVSRNNRSKIYFVCKCKCGTVKDIAKNHLLSGHTTSCCCYQTSKEKRDKLSQWFKDNHEAVAEKGKRHSAYLRSHPEITKTAALKHSEWYKNNPEKAKEIGERHSQLYKDNTDVGKRAGKKISQWYKNNPDKVKEKGERHSQYYKDNQDVGKTAGKKISQWNKDNPDKVKNRAIKSSFWHRDIDKRNAAVNKLLNTCRQKRIKNTDFTTLQNIVSADTYDKLCNGNYDSHSIIDVKCPLCGNYSRHMLKNFYNLSRSKLKYDNVPYCSLCKSSLLSSKYESEIAEYISTFYSGELIRNSREIISPLELDLYYPEKKIAIEFNGDYWHSSEFKDRDYHYSKYSSCRDRDILLISIFEKDWLNNKDRLLEYIRNTFSGLDSDTSFDGNKMNNNYPSLSEYKSTNYYIPDFYNADEHVVYICGYSVRAGYHLENLKVVED